MVEVFPLLATAVFEFVRWLDSTSLPLRSSRPGPRMSSESNLLYSGDFQNLSHTIPALFWMTITKHSSYFGQNPTRFHCSDVSVETNQISLSWILCVCVCVCVDDQRITDKWRREVLGDLASQFETDSGLLLSNFIALDLRFEPKVWGKWQVHFHLSVLMDWRGKVDAYCLRILSYEGRRGELQFQDL